MQPSTQIRLPIADRSIGAGNGSKNRLAQDDRPVHSWYRFVLSFPSHLVREYLTRFEIGTGHTVLDPFCGTGTTLVEAKKLGITSVGIESHPMPHFAASVKTDWEPEPMELLGDAEAIAEEANRRVSVHGGSRRHLPPEAQALLIRDSISPLPLHRVLMLRDTINDLGNPRFRSHQLLALARILPSDVGNLHFGPEVGVAGIKSDAAVVELWLAAVRAMASDLVQVQQLSGGCATVHRADARDVGRVLPPTSVDAVLTSPPYPNEKDYTRTTRLESVILGLINDKQQLRLVKSGLVRSNTRNVYFSDDDDLHVAQFAEIAEVAAAIETKRIALGKTSGFERQYARVTKLYFGGIARHLADLRAVLKPGAHLGYVVGDQASYLQVMIRTGQILGRIAESLGYELIGIDLFRTRSATATRSQLREEVVVLRWPGPAANRA